ncbi:MAG: insulinase family protein [Chitinophagaceae bacterium]|nr:insulinase family protein [Chitinophagaceae bacterium]
MVKKISIALSLLLASFGSFSQAKLVEKVTRTGSELVIPYEKYVLPNGLTLIVHEDHSDPICHVDVTYHVGSAREELGKSGFAHFFEHMMFQGSDHVADEQHFKLITEAGGTLNGTTNRDRTNYFETVPSNQLEKMLWLEADRMGFLLDAVTQKKFEVQRATVKNERGQNYDNRPYGLVQEKLASIMYPVGHPYSWLTIGYVEDLDRVNVEDLKNFFKRWYGPNNAVVTVGGDVNTKEVVKMVEKYFGGIVKGPEVQKPRAVVPVIIENRYAKMTDQYAKLPQLVCAIPTVPAYHPDEAALDCLAEILGGDNASMLFQKLVKKELAQEAYASHPTDELAGNFQIVITPKPGQTLKAMEAVVRESLKELANACVNQEALDKFIRAREAQMIYQLESVSGKVSRLAAFQTFTGDANYLRKEFSRYAQLTLQDVLRAYNTYISNKALVSLYVLTKDYQEELPGQDYKQLDKFKMQPEKYDGLKYVKAKDNFDRSKVPAAGPNPVMKVPVFKQFNDNGIQYIVSESTEIPVVSVVMTFPGGRLAEFKDPSKAGMVRLFTRMMEEDTKSKTSEQMTMELDKLGSSINIGSDLDEITISVRCLKQNFHPTMALLRERLTAPLFKEETFNRIKNETMESIKNSRSRAANMASLAYNKVLFGTHILGISQTGTLSTLKNIELSDMESLYRQLMNQTGLQIAVVGDVDFKAIETIKGIGSILPSNGKRWEFPQVPDFIPNEGKNIYVVNIPRAAQTEFRIGAMNSMTYDVTGDYYKATLMNYPLGGAFNSRLNLNLREEKGWTYGARSGFTANKYFGQFTFSSGIKTPATDSALVEVMREIENFRNKGCNSEELNFLKKAIAQSEARKYETLGQKAGFFANLMKYNLDARYMEGQAKMINELTLDDINQSAQNHIYPEGLFIVLAGDLEKIKPGLQRLGYQVQEIKADDLIN